VVRSRHLVQCDSWLWLRTQCAERVVPIGSTAPRRPCRCGLADRSKCARITLTSLLLCRGHGACRSNPYKRDNRGRLTGQWMSSTDQASSNTSLDVRHSSQLAHMAAWLPTLLPDYQLCFLPRFADLCGAHLWQCWTTMPPSSTTAASRCSTTWRAPPGQTAAVRGPSCPP